MNPSPVADFLEKLRPALEKHGVTLETVGSADEIAVAIQIELNDHRHATSFRIWTENNPRTDVVPYDHPQHRNDTRIGLIRTGGIAHLLNSRCQVALFDERGREPQTWFGPGAQSASFTKCRLRITLAMITEYPNEAVSTIVELVSGLLGGTNNLDPGPSEFTTYVALANDLLENRPAAEALYQRVISGASLGLLDSVTLPIPRAARVRAVSVYLGLDGHPDMPGAPSDREKANLPYWFRSSGLEMLCNNYAKANEPDDETVHGTGAMAPAGGTTK